MIREAKCLCGALRLEAEGEPAAVVACSCTDCQRWTGSVFGVYAYYPEAQTKISGPSKEFVRQPDSGQPSTIYFCPTCGTSLYGITARNPGRIGVAVGAFADPTFRKPDRTIFDRSKHGWVEFGADVIGYSSGRDSARSR